jgi:hypothetical protein
MSDEARGLLLFNDSHAVKGPNLLKSKTYFKYHQF